MKIIKAFIICIVAFSVTSCDTFYRAFLVNGTNEKVTVISDIEINVGNPNLLKLVAVDNGQFIHELEPNSEYVFAASIDIPMTAASIPCDELTLISGRDTLSWNTKEEIFEAMNVISDVRMELRIQN